MIRNKITLRYISSWLLLLVCVLGLSSNKAFASVAVTQLDTSSTTILGVSSYSDVITYLGTPLGTWQSIAVKTSRVANANALYAQIFACNTNTYTSASALMSGCTLQVASSTSVITGTTVWSFATPQTFDQAKYYYFDLQRSSDAQDARIYGTNSSSTASTNIEGIYSLCMWGGADSTCTFIPYLQFQTEQFGRGAFDSAQISSQGVLAKCGFTDISGCFVNALSWAFVPDPTLIDDLSRMSLASSSPFGYAYEMRDRWIVDAATTSAPANIHVNIAAFVNPLVATSTVNINIVSAQEVHDTLGDTIWNFLQLLLKVVFWWGFMWYLWDKATNFV